MELYANDVVTSLAAGVTTGATSLTVTSATGMPAPVGGDFFRLRLEPANPDGTYEIVLVTARVGTTLTVTRAQEGTAAVAWGSGARASMVFSAAAAAALATYFDVLPLVQLERQTDAALRRYGDRVSQRAIDAGVFLSEAWANIAAPWTGTASVGSGRLYNAAGLTRPAPTSTRWMMRTTLHATGAAGKFAYFGVGSSTSGNDMVAIGQGSASTTAAILRGSNITGAATPIPKAFPALTAGDYICTVVVDETHVSLTIQSTPAGQNIWGTRFLRSQLPGAINTIVLSANDTVSTGLTWGPLLVYTEAIVPPAAVRTVGGVNLFGAGNPLMTFRSDPTTGIGHYVSVPGDNDPRVPAPMVAFLHQATTGIGISPWNPASDARMANVTAALEAAGYIIVSSDNGPALTGGGTQDKFANQASLDDYAAAITYARQHNNTGALFLLGPSQGSFVAQNLLQQRVVGGIAAVATISGGSDLIAMEQDPTYQAALRSAYGAADSAAFAVAAAAYNPIGQAGSKFRGVPQRFYIGASDTTAVPAVQTTPFVNKLLPFVPEANVVSVAGVGHLDASLYQGADMVAFFDKYRAADAAGTSTPISPYMEKINAQVTITDPTNQKHGRVDILGDASSTAGWPDRLAFYFTPAGGAAVRSGYHNEYGELRARPAKNNTVSFRAMTFTADGSGTNGHIIEAASGDGNTIYFYVDTAGAVFTVPITAPNIGVPIKGVYNSGSEPTGQPTGTIILVRP